MVGYSPRETQMETISGDQKTSTPPVSKHNVPCELNCPGVPWRGGCNLVETAQEKTMDLERWWDGTLGERSRCLRFGNLQFVLEPTEASVIDPLILAVILSKVRNLMAALLGYFPLTRCPDQVCFPIAASFKVRHQAIHDMWQGW